MAKDHAAPESEYFHKEEQEKLKRLREQAEAEKAAAQAQALKDAHYLHCGKCGNKMVTQLYKGFEIELCASCGAVLLDPGELEALVGKDGSGAVNFVSELFSFRKKKS